MKLLSRLFAGTPVTPRRIETPEWHPLDELDELDVPDRYRRCWRPELHTKTLHGANIDCPEPEHWTEPAQCTAPTKTGRPCSKSPRPGSDRCTLPAHQRETP